MSTVLPYPVWQEPPVPGGHSQAGEAVGRPDLSRNSPGCHFHPAPRPQRSLLEPLRPPTRRRHHPAVGRARRSAHGTRARAAPESRTCGGCGHARCCGRLRRLALLPSGDPVLQVGTLSWLCRQWGSRGRRWGGAGAVLLLRACTESWALLQGDEIEQPRQKRDAFKPNAGTRFEYTPRARGQSHEVRSTWVPGTQGGLCLLLFFFHSTATTNNSVVQV